MCPTILLLLCLYLLLFSVVEPKFYKEDDSLLRTVVSSRSQHIEIEELEDLRTVLLPNIHLLCLAFVTAL
jgi:hypothetical protein